MKNFSPRRLAAATVLAAVVAAGPVRAATDIDSDCLPHIRRAEGFYRIPPGLLEAMALTESGQAGQPYPWTLNIAGRPVFAPNYEAAARQLRNNRGQPRRDVAIGCMQLHMRFHLAPFGNPEWALLPRYNVWYAARFLNSLHQTYGDWDQAVAHYNASDPLAQQRYLCQVARHLRATAPQMSPPACRTAPAEARRRRATMAARRIGRLIVISGR